jgi:hypothetical protein
MTAGDTTATLWSRRSSKALDARMAQIQTRLAQSASDSARMKVTLVAVHEVLRRRAANAVLEPDETTIEPRRFDPSRWPESNAERLEVYRSLVDRVRERIRLISPPASRVAVVSRGDERLLDVPGINIVHFPHDRNGRYAGHYPPDGEAAVLQVQDLASARTAYLVLPATAFWWLDHYAELGRFLEPLAVHADEDCAVYDLRQALKPRGATT